MIWESWEGWIWTCAGSWCRSPRLWTSLGQTLGNKVRSDVKTKGEPNRGRRHDAELTSLGVDEVMCEPDIRVQRLMFGDSWYCVHFNGWFDIEVWGMPAFVNMGKPVVKEMRPPKHRQGKNVQAVVRQGLAKAASKIGLKRGQWCGDVGLGTEGTVTVRAIDGSNQPHKTKRLQIDSSDSHGKALPLGRPWHFRTGNLKPSLG